jgi:hypothetical protein
MDWNNCCVFINEAGFNMHIRRNFERSKTGESAKIELPNNKGITITIIGAICEKSIVDLIVRKPKTVQRKAVSSKEKKKRRQV